MLNTILVPVDGSDLSDRVLSVLERLRPEALKVVLLRVLPRTPEGRYAQETYDDAFAHLYGLEDRLRKEGVQAVHMLTIGEPAPQILDAVRVVEPSLVLMASHGRGGLLRTLRGSVAEEVLERCPVPLLVASARSLPLEPANGFANILVPLDGSDRSARILPYVASLALAHGAAVTLLHVAEGGVAEEALGAYRDRLAQDGVEQVNLRLESGDPAEAIAGVADEGGADLLALASHSKVEGVTAWFGSVADGVLRRVSCPLFVVRLAQPD